MSLSTRIAAFFLLALALVLAGFSLTVYVVAGRYLARQLDERLEAALDTLEASLDVEPGGMEWEPNERRILVGTEPDAESVRWTISTLDGTRVDASANVAASDFPANWRPENLAPDQSDASLFTLQSGWRIAGRRLLLEDLLRQGRGHPEDDGPENDVEYPGLLLTAGASQAPLQSMLRTLLATLVVTSLALWMVFALLGLLLCRRALDPLRRMASVARQLHAERQSPLEPVSGRLPLPGTHDELAELAVAFNELLDRLHVTLARQRRFAGEASHQLRTPLAGMLAQLDVLLRRDRTAEDYRSGLEQVHGEAQRMRQIVESLLFLARSEADAEPVATEPLDLRQWLPAHLEHWGNHTRAADLRLQLPPEALVIAGQASLVAQLVDNLLDNACQYSPAGSPITVSAARHGARVQLAVTDAGDGIADDDLEHLFEPFFRGDQARQRTGRGVGLGLAVARRIAAALGAAISVETRLGHGSRFVVDFAWDGPPLGAATRQAAVAQNQA